MSKIETIKSREEIKPDQDKTEVKQPIFLDIKNKGEYRIFEKLCPGCNKPFKTGVLLKYIAPRGELLEPEKWDPKIRQRVYEAYCPVCRGDLS